MFAIGQAAILGAYMRKSPEDTAWCARGATSVVDPCSSKVSRLFAAERTLAYDFTTGGGCKVAAGVARSCASGKVSQFR